MPRSKYEKNSQTFNEPESRKGRRIAFALAIFFCIIFAAGIAVITKISGINDSSVLSNSNIDFDIKTNEDSQETENIVITLFGDKNTLVIKGESYLESGCHAIDASNKENIDNIKASGYVDTSKPGTYEITYTATNKSGQFAKATRSVKVVDSFEKGNAKTIPVCMYHYVYDSSNQPSQLDNNWIEGSKFKQEMEWLKANNFYYPSYEELIAFVEGSKTLPNNSVILTFDDGMPQFLDTGISILEELEIPATSFIICDDSDAKEKVLSHPGKFVQYQSHSYAMHHAGSGIGHGGIIHKSSYETIVADQERAKEMLGNEIAYAYPFGDYNDTAKSALSAAGVKCAFTTENRQVRKGDDLLALPRVRINGSYTLEQFISVVS